MIKKIELTNYRLYSHFEKDFDEKLEIIQGRNGTGKSTIVEAIGYALQGSKVQKGTGGSWVKEGETNGGVTLYIDDFIIHRYTNKQVVTHVDGEVLARGHTGINEWIEQEYGLTPELFTTSFYVRQKDVDSFSALSPMERTKRVEKLLRVDILDKVKKSVNEKLKYVKIEHSELTVKLSQASFNQDNMDALKTTIESSTKEIAVLEAELKELEAEAAVYKVQKDRWDNKVKLLESMTLEATESETNEAIRRYELDIKKAIKADENNKIVAERENLGKILGDATQAKKYFKYSIEDLMNHKKLLKNNKAIENELVSLNEFNAVQHKDLEDLKYELQNLHGEIQDLEQSPNKCKACGQDMPDKAITAKRLKDAITKYEKLEKSYKLKVKEDLKYELQSEYCDPEIELDIDVDQAIEYVELKHKYERYEEIKDYKFIKTMSLDYIESELETWRKHKVALDKLETYSDITEAPEPVDVGTVMNNLNKLNNELHKAEQSLRSQEIAKAVHEEFHKHYLELGVTINDLKNLVKFIDTYRKEFSENIVPLLAENVSKIMAYLTEDKYEEVVINKDYSIEKYDFFSGSEEDSVNFALRLAIAQISRLGTFDTMILDEIAASFDSVKENLLLDILKTTDMQLIYISHGDI